MLLLAVAFAATVLASSSFAHSVHGFPKASCNPHHGKLCFPHACKNVTCERIPDAICIPDRCGCEARFFKWQAETKRFHDITKVCFASKSIEEAGRFVKDLTETKRRDLVTTDIENNPDVVGKTFVSLNLLASEALEAIAYYLKESSEKTPTEENIQRFEMATEKLRMLKRHRQRLGIRLQNENGVDENTFNRTDFLAVNSIWTVLMKDLKEAIHIGKRMYKIMKEAKHDTQRVTLMDEDTGETMDAEVPVESQDSIENVVENDLDIAEDLMADEGTFSDVMIPERKVCIGPTVLGLCVGIQV